MLVFCLGIPNLINIGSKKLPVRPCLSLCKSYWLSYPRARLCLCLSGFPHGVFSVAFFVLFVLLHFVVGRSVGRLVLSCLLRSHRTCSALFAFMRLFDQCRELVSRSEPHMRELQLALKLSAEVQYEHIRFFCFLSDGWVNKKLKPPICFKILLSRYTSLYKNEITYS